MLRVRHDDCALALDIHHAVSAVVHYCQRLSVGVFVVIDLSLELIQDLFNFGHAEILLLNDFRVFVKAVLLDVRFEEFYVLFDCGEVYEAKLFWVSIFVLYQVSSFVFFGAPSDGRIVDVANDEALSSVWAEAGQAGFHFADHCSFWWSEGVFCLFCFALLISSTLFYPYKG